MNVDVDIPFRFDIGEGRAARDWLTKEGVKELFTMFNFPIRWGLLSKIAYRKCYTKEKVSETIGNLIYAFGNNFKSLNSGMGKDNRSVKCVISKDIENLIMDIWYDQMKKKPFHATVIDMALYNGFVTMEQLDIPINPDTTLLWSRYLTGQIKFSEIQNSIYFNPRRIDNDL